MTMRITPDEDPMGVAEFLGLPTQDEPHANDGPNPDECVRLCEAIAAFWGDAVCDAPIHPGAYLTEQDIPIRDLVRAAVGLPNVVECTASTGHCHCPACWQE